MSKNSAREQGSSGSKGDWECSVLRVVYRYLQSVGKSYWSGTAGRGASALLSFKPSNTVLSSSAENKRKKQSPSHSWCLSPPLAHSCCCHGSSHCRWRMLWGPSSSSPAVLTALGASGCSHGWISDRFLHCLPCRVLGLPSPENVCSSMAILLITGSTTQQWHNLLLLLHQVQRPCLLVQSCVCHCQTCFVLSM